MHKSKKIDALLLKRHPVLGYQGDVIRVSRGFARNFLVKNGIVAILTPKMESMRLKLIKEAEHEVAKHKNDILSKLAEFENFEFNISVMIDIKGGLYGSITSVQLADMINDKFGFSLRKRDILLERPIRHVGVHTVPFRAFKNKDDEVIGTVKINVSAENVSSKKKNKDNKKDITDLHELSSDNVVEDSTNEDMSQMYDDTELLEE